MSAGGIEAEHSTTSRHDLVRENHSSSYPHPIAASLKSLIILRVERAGCCLA
jgi:hypothetical protein